MSPPEPSDAPGRDAPPSASRPGFDGWCLFPPEAVPERWRGRAVTLSLVPLLPGEVKSILDGTPAVPELAAEDEAIARLAARGLTIEAIARAVGMSVRGVQNRLARLRDRFGVGSTAELRAVLARKGL